MLEQRYVDLLEKRIADLETLRACRERSSRRSSPTGRVPPDSVSFKGGHLVAFLGQRPFAENPGGPVCCR
jgi:hypothetical protein